MKNLRYFAQRYIDWLIKLGRLRFSLMGFFILAVLALCTHIVLSYAITGEIHWESLLYSIIFGLISAPFVIYFFTLLVEQLELSRQHLAKSVVDLKQEIDERILAEQRLAQADQNKMRLMTTISHELRTPLNGIVGLSQILLDSQLDEQQRNYLNTIHMSAMSLGYIFNDIIDLEKIDGKKIALYQRESDFISLLDDIQNIGCLMAEQKGLGFSLNRGQNLPHFLHLDGTRLSQILWNLVNNAVKFTHRGKITVSVNRLSEQEYEFVVRDTGQGIPTADLDNIFMMYYQVADNQHKPAGSGIGLAISRNIAQLMGGDLTVQSELGQGSAFRLTIRAQESEKNTLPQNTVQSLGLHILLVEDIELNVVVARSLLEKLGCEVDVAMTGKQAFELFEKNTYDLLLLDIQLPDMTGFDIARQLRQDYEQDNYDYLPLLVALTANVMQDKAQYQAQGMDDVLRKPLSLDALSECLQRYFSVEIGTTLQQEKEQSEVLNLSLLNELGSMLGTTFIQQNLALFEQTMPSYMDELHQAFRQFKQDAIYRQQVADIAHKIKGAAAALGLSQIQRVAEFAQHEQQENWDKHIADWVTQLSDWQSNVIALKQWLD